jgi:hypothetical protein
MAKWLTNARAEGGKMPRSEIDEYQAAADATLGSFIGRFDGQPPPNTIYHYTDDRGLRGIIESGKLWFTDIFDLNDPSELRHGFSFAVKALDDREKSKPTGAAVALAQDFARFLHDGGIEHAAHFFVCCFSSDGDELVQWRAYADDGRGYALGFSGQKLENEFTQPTGTPTEEHSTFPITYDDAMLDTIQGEMADSLFRLVGSASAFDQEWSIYHSVNAMRATIFFKHPAYRNEKEFRFQQLYRVDRAPEVEFRQRPYSLVRFRQFDWRPVAPDALKEIVVGPAAGVAEMQFAVDCVAAYNPAHRIDIKKSRIPYRGSS